MLPSSTRRRYAAAAAAFVFNMAIGAAQIFSSSFYDKTPYHTSTLTGHSWVQELIYGHPDRIKSELGMRLHVFEALAEELRNNGLSDTRHITLEEHVAIFLYTCVTGLSIRHVGERFQHANATISKYVLGNFIWQSNSCMKKILLHNSICSFISTILYSTCSSSNSP